MLTRAELFVAAEAGDVAAFERFFTQPTALEAALAVEARVTTDTLLDLDGRVANEWAFLDENAWVYLDGHSDCIFAVAITHRQYEVLAWLLSSPIAVALLRTTQFFLVDAATTAAFQRDIYALELLFASLAWRRYPDRGRSDLLSMILKAGIEGRSPRILDLLVAHGADVNRPLRGQRIPQRPLSIASARDPSSTVAFALRDLGAFTIGNRQALYTAAMWGRHDAVVGLVELGVDPHERDGQHNTALHQAAEQGYYATVAALLQHAYVDMDAQNRVGATALMEAAHVAPDWNHAEGDDAGFANEIVRDKRTCYRQSIGALLEHGADPDMCASGEYFGFGPLHWAVRTSSVDVFENLLVRGANPNVQSAVERQTPAHMIGSLSRQKTCSTYWSTLTSICRSKIEMGTQRWICWQRVSTDASGSRRAAPMGRLDKPLTMATGMSRHSGYIM